MKADICQADNFAVPSYFLIVVLVQKSRLLSRILPYRLLYLNSVMLSPSHNRAYQDFSSLLIELNRLLSSPEGTIDLNLVDRQFQPLSLYYQENILQLDYRGLAPAIASRWQSVQTEIKREFKLLSTDFLFLASARQNSTQTKRLKSISDRLSKLIGYCQILLDK